MAHISGYGGSILVGTTTGTGIKSWSLDYTRDTIESTDFADAGVKSYIIGCSGWAGSFEGYKDAINSTLILATATCLLTLNESATSGQSYIGAAYITGIHPAAEVGGIVSYSYDFQGTGALTVATA